MTFVGTSDNILSMRSEDILQIHFADWLDKQSVLYSASCGGMRTGIHTARKMKRMGYRKGCPDIMIFEARGGYGGLFIELKSKTGSATPEQKEWQRRLILGGYQSYIMPIGMDFQQGLDWLKKKASGYLYGKQE